MHARIRIRIRIRIRVRVRVRVGVYQRSRTRSRCRRCCYLRGRNIKCSLEAGSDITLLVGEGQNTHITANGTGHWPTGCSGFQFIEFFGRNCSFRQRLFQCLGTVNGCRCLRILCLLQQFFTEQNLAVFTQGEHAAIFQFDGNRPIALGEDDLSSVDLIPHLENADLTADGIQNLNGALKGFNGAENCCHDDFSNL